MKGVIESVHGSRIQYPNETLEFFSCLRQRIIKSEASFATRMWKSLIEVWPKSVRIGRKSSEVILSEETQACSTDILNVCVGAGIGRSQKLFVTPNCFAGSLMVLNK